MARLWKFVGRGLSVCQPWAAAIAYVGKDVENKPRLEFERYPLCLDGERSCPPENVGGASGYAEMLEALADPHHDDHAGYTERVGAGFDPAACDLEAINAMLRCIQ